MTEEVSEVALLRQAFQPSIGDALGEMVLEDKELPIFLSKWFETGLNAGAAYKDLHPGVSDASARVLGCRKLTKVNVSAILAAYDLEFDDYFKLLKQGLTAMKWNEFTGELVPDYKTRALYHRTLGRLLGLEDTKPSK